MVSKSLWPKRGRFDAVTRCQNQEGLILKSGVQSSKTREFWKVLWRDIFLLFFSFTPCAPKIQELSVLEQSTIIFLAIKKT